MTSANHIAAKAALDFYIDHGVDECVQDDAINRLLAVEPLMPILPNHQPLQSPGGASAAAQAAAAIPLGKNDARIEAAKLAQNANTLEELRTAIADFDGIAIKKTATNLVFADGNPKSPIMLIGEAPAAEEDRQGKPFVGPGGQLLDKILACIDLARAEEDPAKAAYLTTLLNWRPPGNRSPNPAEIEVSLPFVERHIQLIQPKLLIFCGGVPAKALLGSGDSISRLRKTWHDYTPKTPELAANASPIPAIVTYAPDYLITTPAQKKSTWADMLALQSKYREILSAV